MSKVVGRLRVSGGSTSSTSGRHGVCLEASHRDVLPLPAWALGGTLDPVAGSERNQTSSLFGNNMLGGNFLNSSPLSSQNSGSSRGSRSSSSTTREWAGYGAGHWPIDSWPAGLAGKDRASKELSPLGSLASAEVLAAKPSTKVSASYSWRRDGLATFQATPSPPAPVSSSSASSSFPSHDAAAAAAAALSDGASEVQQAPGAVAVSGASFATFAEFAGAGLVHALLAPYTTTAALAQRYAPGGKSTSAGGDSRSISNDSNTTSRKSDKSSLGGDVAHFIKLAAAGRWAFPLTGAYEYTLPAPPSPETAAVAANLRAEHVVDEVAGSGSGAKRGAAAGAVLNLSLDLGWLCPLSSSPFHDLAVPTTASATGQATSASTEKGPQRSSHLVDRFFLGGPTRASALLAPPSNGSSSGGGMSSVFTPPAHLGLRGFAVGGCGPRAAAAPLSSPLGGGEASSSNDGEDDDKPGTKNGGAFGGFRNNNNNNNSSSSNGPVFRNALGGDLRCAVAAELSVPAPLPTLAAAGVRGSASVQAGLLAPCANLWNSTHSSGGSVLNGTSLNASASIGVGIPLGAGAGVEVLCSKPITWSAQDRPERWQLAIGLGIGS